MFPSQAIIALENRHDLQSQQIRKDNSKINTNVVCVLHSSSTNDFESKKDDDFVSQEEQAAGSKDLSVIVYCASHECGSSEQADQPLEQAAFANVSDYEGGVKSWSEAGEQLVAGA